MECHHHPRPTLISHGDSYHGAGYNIAAPQHFSAVHVCSSLDPGNCHKPVPAARFLTLLMSEGAGIGGASVSWTPAPLTWESLLRVKLSQQLSSLVTPGAWSGAHCLCCYDIIMWLLRDLSSSREDSLYQHDNTWSLSTPDVLTPASAAVSPPSALNSHWLRHLSLSRPGSRRRLTAPRLGCPAWPRALYSPERSQTGLTIKRKYAGRWSSTMITLPLRDSFNFLFVALARVIFSSKSWWNQ